jgi:radical SAM superfamily enzyme YgiQ (UPF0313 family)
MDGFPLNYNLPLFRPPSEAASLIFQVTLGCSWNRCSFCEMYPGKRFSAKHEKVIRDEIKKAAAAFPSIRKIFLADGNAMVLSFRRLNNILDTINGSFPDLNRVSCYALPHDIISKSTDELIQLRQKGLKLIYVGIESGDDEILKMVNKSETFDSTTQGLNRAREAGIKVSAMILTGLAGKKYSEQHAVNSARIVNATQPDYLSTLMLMFPHGIDHFKKRFGGTFIPMNQEELLLELERFIARTDLERTIFRSDHASNYLILKGILSRDKERFLETIKEAIKNPRSAGLRPEWLRGL